MGSCSPPTETPTGPSPVQEESSGKGQFVTDHRPPNTGKWKKPAGVSRCWHQARGPEGRTPILVGSTESPWKGRRGKSISSGKDSEGRGDGEGGGTRQVERVGQGQEENIHSFIHSTNVHGLHLQTRC